MEGGLIALGPGIDPRLGFVDHTGPAAILNFRNGALSVGGFAFDVVNDEINRPGLGGGRYSVIGRDRGEYVSALQLFRRHLPGWDRLRRGARGRRCRHLSLRRAPRRLRPLTL